MKQITWIVTCEHASRSIPGEFRAFFKNATDVLKSHRGYDLGAAEAAEEMARLLGAPNFMGEWSRLLVELNRSPHHQRLWSEFTSPLPREVKAHLMDTIYRPYRDQVADKIASLSRKGKIVVHLSIHTFTPELHGKVRSADIGLLYDPRREHEKNLCSELASSLGRTLPEFRIRKNYPYRGCADGFTTALRKLFAGDIYLGIEIEINNMHTRRIKNIANAIASALKNLSLSSSP